MIARVIVNIPSSNVDQEFDYIVPTNAEEYTKVGSRVRVSFGQANREIMGFVLDIREETHHDGMLKEILEVVDYEPVISKEQLEIAKFIKEDAICPLIRILNLMIPDALKLKTTKYLEVLDYNKIDAELIDLFKGEKLIPYSLSMALYDTKILREVKKGNIKISYNAKSTVFDKMINKYVLDQNFTYLHFNELKNAKQKAFLEALHGETPLTIAELIEKYEISNYHINALYKKGFLKRIREKESRIRVRNIPINKKIRLIDDKIVNSVLEKIKVGEKPILFMPKDNFEQTKALLQIVNYYQKENKNVVIFTPEILTSYTIENVVRKNTGLSVALINSNLSEGEMLDYYNEIKNDSYSVIVTTSKGIFFPYQNVGAYILLDSDSDNYFNDQSPRYDLHKVVVEMAKLNNSSVAMFSFVPTLYDYTYGLKGYYDVIESDVSSPVKDVRLVDLKEDLRKGNNSPISLELLRQIRLAKAKGRSSLLILNNKSYSSYVMCRNCGTVVKCDRCGLSMQYNKKKEMLLCPACASKRPFDNMCPSCGNNNLKLGGFGIEQVEEDLKEKLPDFKTAILDTTNFELFSMINTDLDDGVLDVVITTDNYAKSIDVNNIGLVGIINIDSVSKVSSYDANERAYRMLVNAKNKISDIDDGILLVQSYSEIEQFMKDFLANDYHEFVKNEIVTRKILKNEPFYYINRIIVKGKYETMFKDADDIKKMLKEALDKEVFIMGPTYNYQYQGVQLIIKHRLSNISEIYANIYSQYQSSATMIIFDKYPKYI